MGKDPAFLFYPGDWMGGTMGMTFEEKGCYLELLMMQFNNGKFTEQQVKQVLSVCFPHAWPTLKHKFQTDGTYYWNERLQIEIEKRSKFIESRRLSGLTPKKEKAYAKHTLKRGEDEDVNENIIKNITEIYNNTPFAKIQKLTNTRKAHLSARVKDYSEQVVIDTILSASKSDFLTGKNDRSWKADFDWLMNPNNFIKVMEGKYANKVPKRVLA